MRLLTCAIFIVLSEASDIQRGRHDNDDKLLSALQKKVDVYPEHFAEPVPFGHIFLEGVSDPFSPIKNPVDFLELDMVAPKNEREAREMLQKADKKNIQYLNRKHNIFLSPRDKYIDEIPSSPEDKRNETELKIYSIAEIQRLNAMGQGPSIHRPAVRKPAVQEPVRQLPPRKGGRTKLSHFSKDTFHLNRESEKLKQNWTTCDQFAVGAVFSPKHIVNLEWIPFYIWSPRLYPHAVVHKFMYPSRKVVSEYRMRYEKYLNKTLDWNQPKLLLKGMAEMLLIAADKRGLFDTITKHDIPESAITEPITVPSFTIRLKIEDPYLMMMFCDEYFATIMAISGNEPTELKEIKDEVATIKFKGVGRAVWRDLEGERERLIDKQQRNNPEVQRKNIREEEPLPDFDK